MDWLRGGKHFRRAQRAVPLQCHRLTTIESDGLHRAKELRRARYIVPLQPWLTAIAMDGLHRAKELRRARCIVPLQAREDFWHADAQEAVAEDGDRAGGVDVGG
jgi:hypothetical protein